MIIWMHGVLLCGGGRVGLRRRFKAPISSEARVRIPSSAVLFHVLWEWDDFCSEDMSIVS
jgi:siroheme synthase (precorrin-2 oxidase/ferrochelatase)